MTLSARRLPITRVPVDGLPERALVCGDPARAARIAQRLEEAQEVGRNREYHTYRGRYRGVDLVVASHGVGAAGAAVAFEELIRAGVRALVRVGTCGSFVDDLADGDLLIPSAAAREDGLTERLVPRGFPAVADAGLAAALATSAERLGVRYRRGIVVSNDAFYPGVLEPVHRLYATAGALGVEMECSALFVVAALRRARAAAVLAVDGHPLRRQDEGLEYDPHRAVVHEAIGRQIEVALDAMAGLAL